VAVDDDSQKVTRTVEEPFSLEEGVPALERRGHSGPGGGRRRVFPHHMRGKRLGDTPPYRRLLQARTSRTAVQDPRATLDTANDIAEAVGMKLVVVHLD
jgi:hypothetical protein